MYLSRPTTRTARRAWDAFTKAIGQEPADISFGYAEFYGRVWTATENSPEGINIWLWSNKDQKVRLMYGPNQRRSGIAWG